MPIIEIKHRHTGDVLYSGEALSLKELLENAVEYGANLVGANLYGANLVGANIGNNIIISKQPITVSNTIYPVMIFDAHMKIGCKLYSLAEWWGFDNRAIAEMDGKQALEFWGKWKPALQAICEAEGRA